MNQTAILLTERATLLPGSVGRRYETHRRHCCLAISSFTEVEDLHGGLQVTCNAVPSLVSADH